MGKTSAPAAPCVAMETSRCRGEVRCARTLARLTSWLGAKVGANIARLPPTSGYVQRQLSQAVATPGDAWRRGGPAWHARGQGFESPTLHHQVRGLLRPDQDHPGVKWGAKRELPSYSWVAMLAAPASRAQRRIDLQGRGQGPPVLRGLLRLRAGRPDLAAVQGLRPYPGRGGREAQATPGRAGFRRAA